MLLCRRAFFEVQERVILQNVSGGRPPDPQVLLEEADTLVSDKYLSIDDLHLKRKAYQLMGPGGLDSCPFQQKNESDLFCSAFSFQKGRFINMEKAWSQKCCGDFAPCSPFSFSYRDKNWQ